MKLSDVIAKRLARSQPLQLVALGFFLIAFNAFLNSFVWKEVHLLPEIFRLVLPTLGTIAIMVGITMEAYDYLRRGRRPGFFDFDSETRDIQDQLNIQDQLSAIKSEIAHFHAQRMVLGDA